MTVGVLVRERRQITKTLWGALAPESILSGRFEGFGSIYGIVDDQNDLVRDGTFAKSARQKGAGLPIGWEHELSHPAGVALALSEVGRAALPPEVQARFPDATGGLHVQGQVTLTALNRHRIKAVRQVGAPLGLSAKFYALQERPLAGRPGVAEIFEGSLEEISLTVAPANTGSFVTVMKSLQSRRRSFPGVDVSTADPPPAAAPAVAPVAPSADLVARRLAFAESLVRTPLQ